MADQNPDEERTPAEDLCPRLAAAIQALEEGVPVSDVVPQFPELEERIRSYAGGIDVVREAAAAEPPAEPPALPRPFSWFILEECLGRGGFGEIFRARPRWFRTRDLALKMLRADKILNPVVLARFRREVQALERLDHRNIVQMYCPGQCDGTPFFLMRLVPGKTLGVRKADYADPRAGATIIMKVARALDHAHGNGVVSRDVSPNNILIDEMGEPVVIDFGLASISEVTDLTETGDIFGTLPYMSPEMAAGDGCDARSDIYSLGVILFELLTGRQPFTGNNRGEVLRHIRSDMPASLRSIRQDLDEQLELICLKCLQKLRRHRYQTAAALADDLRQWLGGSAITARRPRRIERALEWRYKNSTLASTIGVSGLVIMLLAAVTGVVWWHDRRVTQVNKELEFALIEVRDNQKRAELNGDVAADAARTALELTRLLAEHPGGDPERQQKLDVLVKRLDDLHAANPQPQNVRGATALAHFLRGKARMDLGEFALAADDFGKAEQLYTGLEADYPNEPEYRHDLASTLVSLGDAETRWGVKGYLERAQKYYSDGVAMLCKLVTGWSDRSRYKLTMAIAQINWAALLTEHRIQLQMAMDLYVKARNELHKLVGDAPLNAAYLDHLAIAHAGIAGVKDALERRDEAVPEYRKALEIRIVEGRRPEWSTPERRYRLARDYYNFGTSLNRIASQARTPITLEGIFTATLPVAVASSLGLGSLGHSLPVTPLTPGDQIARSTLLDLVLAASRSGELVLRDLASEFPHRSSYRRDLMNVKNLQATVLYKRNMFEDARKAHGQALVEADEFVRIEKATPNSLAIRSTGRAMWARTEFAAGSAARSCELLKGAIDDLGQAIAGTRPADGGLSLRKDWVEYQRENYALLIVRRLSLQDHNAASKAVEGLAGTYLPTDVDELAVALFYCECAAIAQADSKLQGADRVRVIEDYREQARGLLNRYSKRAGIHENPVQLSKQAWLYAANCDVEFRNPEKAVELARRAKAMAGSPTPFTWRALGIACVRNRLWDEAKEALDQSVKNRSGGDAIDWLGLAVACHHRGEQVEARQWYDRARAALKHSPLTMIQRQLLEDAEREFAIPPK